jgi:hypothetical protein
MRLSMAKSEDFDQGPDLLLLPGTWQAMVRRERTVSPVTRILP